MADPRRFRLRAQFVKQNRAALLSHLEIAHTLERTVRRANLPFAITQGFSPHMKIAFGAALPVGVGSTCEIFDLNLTDYVPDEVALEALQQASVDDLMVQSCAYIEPNAAAASVAFPFSTYEVTFDAPVDAAVIPQTITVIRKKKERVLTVADYLVKPFEYADQKAVFTLEAKQTGSLRPDVLCAQCEFPAEVMTITRIAQAELPSE